MSNFLAVIPVLVPQTANVCIQSILMPDSSAGLDSEDILLIDNSKAGFAGKYMLRTHRDPEEHNLGVARSWNIGAKEVVERKLDYLIIISAAMQFGPRMHCTWVSQMEANWDQDIIEAAGHSWHLTAIHRRVFEAIGFFDTNFYPAYFEDIDFCYRMRMHGFKLGWPRVWVNAMTQGVAMHNDYVSVDAKCLLDYYAEKWGGEKMQEKFLRPFATRPLDYFKETSIPMLAAKYHLAKWW